MKNIAIVFISMLSLQGFGQRKIDFIEYDLPNGIHVILHEDKTTPIVAVSVLYHVGSKNETPDRTGFAHFFEHLLFEGSTNIGRGEYSEIVERNGGALNANTSQDRTYYYEILPSNQLELGLWLESERMLHAKVDITGIETQRSVVKEEKRQRIDNRPYASFTSEIFKRMFSNHPYNWVPIGSMDHLDAAQESDYVNFYRTFYVPQNATISIAGDINVLQAKNWINQYFGSIPSGQAINLYRDYENLEDSLFEKTYGISKSKFYSEDFMNSSDPAAKKIIGNLSKKPIAIPRTEKDFSQLNGLITDTIYDNIQSPGIFMGFKFPDQNHPDSYALDMMNEVLSGGSSSRINKSLVEKMELATFAYAFNYGLEDAGAGLFAAIASQDVELSDIQIAFDEQIKQIQTELISDEEFQKIRNQYENNLVSSNSSVAGVAENLADNYVYFGNTDRVNILLDNYLKVTKEDIQRVAQKYLTLDKRVILYYLPKQ